MSPTLFRRRNVVPFSFCEQTRSGTNSWNSSGQDARRTPNPSTTALNKNITNGLCLRTRNSQTKFPGGRQTEGGPMSRLARQIPSNRTVPERGLAGHPKKEMKPSNIRGKRGNTNISKASEKTSNLILSTRVGQETIDSPGQRMRGTS